MSVVPRGETIVTKDDLRTEDAVLCAFLMTVSRCPVEAVPSARDPRVAVLVVPGDNALLYERFCRGEGAASRGRSRKTSGAPRRCFSGSSNGRLGAWPRATSEALTMGAMMNSTETVAITGAALPADLDAAMARFVSALAVGRSVAMQHVRYVELGDVALAYVERGIELKRVVQELRRRVADARVDIDGTWTQLLARDVGLAAVARRMAREAVGS